jgi:hypothetical protein
MVQARVERAHTADSYCALVALNQLSQVRTTALWTHICVVLSAQTCAIDKFQPRLASAAPAPCVLRVEDIGFKLFLQWIYLKGQESQRREKERKEKK